ncbi:MAG: HAD hydrolase family protein [Acidipropionibacterium sp.]|nr:HAD hydrolase family protein [Acidipropionibacterium sp.]
MGIATVESHLGVDRADTIAIGDGMNDLEMIGYAGTGVAVLGAPAEVLAQAQMTIPGPTEGGIAQCFEELGLIPRG